MKATRRPVKRKSNEEEILYKKSYSQRRRVSRKMCAETYQNQSGHQ
jgi:hypothetical protein